eukprot:scaffold245398_cov23-Cyclotella_meneghiniana.AAC.1
MGLDEDWPSHFGKGGFCEVLMKLAEMLKEKNSKSIIFGLLLSNECVILRGGQDESNDSDVSSNSINSAAQHCRNS